METSECLNLLREVRDCAFATIDKDGQPAVRIIDVMLVEGERFTSARRAARISMPNLWRILP